MCWRGATLKELLVVVAIIALLLGLLFPIGRIVRYRVLEARCRANMMAIMVKYQELRQQHRDRWNARHVLNRWLQRDPEGIKVGFCPLAQKGYGLYTVRGGVVYRNVSLDDFVPCPNPEIVLQCFCHSKPMRAVRTCYEPPEEYHQLLCLFEDGRIEYSDLDLPEPVRLRDCPGARLASDSE